MYLEQRIDLLVGLGEYCLSRAPGLEAAKHRAHMGNGWFIPEFIEEAVRQVATQYLQREKLEAWTMGYGLPVAQPAPRNVGLIMAGNIPLVGFHDMLSIFISGHRQLIKPSSRDEILIRHLAGQLIAMDAKVADSIGFADRLNGCDAYIATGSNNSARYFDYYFGKVPHLIRRNRTSVAVLTGGETWEELEAKYRHNYDYQLTLLILNKKYYMSNGSILLTENASPFSPISVLNYVYYQSGGTPPLPEDSQEIQCIVGRGSNFAGSVPFGQAQQPGLTDYADGIDTMAFLKGLP